jgi:hypothetical protein
LALGGRWTRAAIVRVIALARGATVTAAVIERWAGRAIAARAARIIAGFERTAFGIA